MNRAQKTARINLILILPSAVAIILLWAIELGPIAFWLLVMLMAIVNSRNYYEERSQRDITTFDERDEFITRKASLIAYRFIWTFFGCACLLAWIITKPEGRISVYWLLAGFFGGAVVFNLVFSIAILVQYGWGGKGEKS
jgi:Ca2+/Na+ antiporter